MERVQVFESSVFNGFSIDEVDTINEIFEVNNDCYERWYPNSLNYSFEPY